MILTPGIRITVTQSRAKQAPKQMLKNYIDSVKIGDWFLLDLIARNVDPMRFNEILEQLSDKKNGSNI